MPERFLAGGFLESNLARVPRALPPVEGLESRSVKRVLSKSVILSPFRRALAVGSFAWLVAVGKASRDGLLLSALLAVLALIDPLSPLFTPEVQAQTPQTPIQQNQLDQRNRPGDLRRAPDASARISERQAANLARQRFAGNILRITLIGEGNTQQYQIRMENEGRVFTVFVHAFTGRISGGS